MSLINVRNFIAPLQNKVHIGALIVAALLVAVVRLSHSSPDEQKRPVENRTGDSVEENIDFDQEIAGFLDGHNKGQGAGNGAQGTRARPDDQVLNGLMKDPSQGRRPSPSANKQAAPSGLDDIKKSLGLE